MGGHWIDEAAGSAVASASVEGKGPGCLITVQMGQGCVKT